MGGAISVQLVSRYPQLIRSLTLVSPALPDLIPMRTSIQLPVIAVPGIGPDWPPGSPSAARRAACAGNHEPGVRKAGHGPRPEGCRSPGGRASHGENPWSGRPSVGAPRGIWRRTSIVGPDAPWKPGNASTTQC